MSISCIALSTFFSLFSLIKCIFTLQLIPSWSPQAKYSTKIILLVNVKGQFKHQTVQIFATLVS